MRGTGQDVLFPVCTYDIEKVYYMIYKIKQVDPASIAEECGIMPGDRLLSINGHEVEDYIDYAYCLPEQELVLLIETSEGEQVEIFIEKEPYEDIGLVFEDDGFGRKIVCKNKCLFCFVDQMPRQMRKTLYFKDDDWRMSFMMGSYITLTNLSEQEIERIIAQKISPIYVSVHAWNDDLRCLLLGTKAAKKTTDIMRRLAQNGIKMHTQLVVCEGINDGEVLAQSIDELYAMFPQVLSVAVIPVGLTKYREKLHPLKPISKENAATMIGLIHARQKKFLLQSGTRFVFGADELYIRAGLPMPGVDEYEEFEQIENGVGLVAMFCQEVHEALSELERSTGKRERVGVVTGVDFYPFMMKIAEAVMERTGIELEVHGIKNKFFGETVTVTGLLTGRDIIEQLKGKTDVGRLLLSSSCFKETEDVMLDDIGIEELSKALGVPCVKVRADGYDFVAELLK